MTWARTPLGELVTLQRGYDLPARDRREGQVPVITSSGHTGFHDVAAATGPGVVTGRYGTIGDVHYVEGEYWPHNTTLFVRDFKGNDPKFVRYLLTYLDLAGQVSSGAVPGVNRNVLHAMSVPAVPQSAQARIGEVLSAYDDLIENNRRRMALLEDAARHLYREWFVHLRFPGHELTRPRDGVPTGWQRQTLADLCDAVDYGYTASASHEIIGPKFLRITDIVPDIIDWPSVPHCAIDEKKYQRVRLRTGDVVIARTGSVGYAKRLGKRLPDAVFASYLVRVRFKPSIDDVTFGVFVESDEYKSYVRSRVGGVAQPNANAKVLTSADVLVPPHHVQQGFRALVEPLLDQREVLQCQSEKLRSARDLLLPRLMSGQLSV